jgi:hypothetical protein
VINRTTPGARPSEALGNPDAVAALKQRFRRQDMLLVSLLFGVLLLFPRMPGTEGWMLAQAAVVIIYIIAAQGVALLVGYTGLVTVGHGGFLAIGAYTAAMLTKFLGVDMLIAIAAGGLMAAFIGMLLGLVFLRLAGPFMAIGTLGFAFFIGTVVNNVPVFEGREGISLAADQQIARHADRRYRVLLRRGGCSGAGDAVPLQPAALRRRTRTAGVARLGARRGEQRRQSAVLPDTRFFSQRLYHGPRRCAQWTRDPLCGRRGLWRDLVFRGHAGRRGGRVAHRC